MKLFSTRWLDRVNWGPLVMLKRPEIVDVLCHVGVVILMEAATGTQH